MLYCVQDHFTSGDWKFLKSSAMPSFRTSWKKNSQQRIRNCTTYKCGTRFPVVVLNDDPKSTLTHQDMLRSFEVNLKAEQNQLVMRRDGLEAKLQLLDEILSLRQLESLEMEYGLESDVCLESASY